MELRIVSCALTFTNEYPIRSQLSDLASSFSQMISLLTVDILPRTVACLSVAADKCLHAVA
jgi:hypothetical protein